MDLQVHLQASSTLESLLADIATILLLVAVLPHMHLQLAHVRILLLAKLTLDRLLPGVDHPVSLQMTSLHESLPAKLTPVRPLTGVNPQMHLQSVRPRKTLPAKLTPLPFPPQMLLLVRLQRIRADKLRMAQLTAIPLPAVPLEVDPHVDDPLKSLPANLTLQRLVRGVQFGVVLFQINLKRKPLVAYIALEGPLLCVDSLVRAQMVRVLESSVADFADVLVFVGGLVV